MEEFLKGLFSLLIQFEVIKSPPYQYTPIIFSAGCAIIGILTVFTDLSFYIIRGESALSLRHGWKNTIFFLIAWAFGAAFLGYVGQMLNIFQVSLLACATVGLSWPIIFTKVLAKMRESEESQEITEEE